MTEHRVEDLQRLYVLLGRVNALPVSVNGECCHVNGEYCQMLSNTRIAFAFMCILHICVGGLLDPLVFGVGHLLGDLLGHLFPRLPLFLC